MVTIKKILLPVDFSGTSVKVLNQAILLAKKTDAEIHLLTIIEGPFGGSSPDGIHTQIYENEKYEGFIVDAVDERIKKMKEKLLREGVRAVEFIIEKGGTPYAKIVYVAERIGADLIIMGTHGISGFREFVMGSNAFKVVSEAKCPVLSIQKHTENPGFNNILLPFRDKPHSREGVDYAIRIAKIYGATLHILGISYDPATAEVKKIPLEAEQIKEIAESSGVTCTVKIAHGNYVSKLILNYATSINADILVVMADLDKMGISEYIAGPVIQQIVNHSTIPVLSIRPIINDAMYSNNEVDWAF